MNYLTRRKLYVFLMMLFSAHSSYARGGGGSLVGNGAGLAEMEIAFAYTNLASVIQQCLSKKTCGLNEGEELLLQQELNILAQYPDPSMKLKFLSEAQSPGFFFTGNGEHHRVAKTENFPSATIFINRDLIYNQLGRSSIDVAFATALLVHELGHQVGVDDHLWLDTLGSKLRSLLQKTKNEISHPYEDLSAIQYSDPLSPLSFALFLENDVSSIDLTNRILAALSCPSGASKTSIKSINPHWVLSEGKNLFEMFSVYIKYACTVNNRVMIPINAQVSITIPQYHKNKNAKLSHKDIGFSILLSQ